MAKKPEKVTGIRHIFAAASYSLAGAQRLFQETAARHEVLAFAVIVMLFLATGVRLFNLTMATLLFLLLLAVEAINTAIEEVVDLVSPQWSEPAKHAKDLGSLAVLCLLIGNGLFATYSIVSAVW